MTLKEIVEQLRMCGYVCEAGPLELNVAFIELVKMAEGKDRLRHIQDLTREIDDPSTYNPCRNGHVFAWTSPSTAMGGDPPNGTFCACGKVAYRGR